MNRRDFGKTGLRFGEVGFGAWALGGQWGGQDDAESEAALLRALDLGCDFIDTAEVYGDGRSERVIAEVLARRGGDRPFVATKTPPVEGPWPPSPYCDAAARYPEDHLRRNVEERLRNLGVERLDLLQLHTWTRAWNDDPTPLEVLRRLREEGKIRLIGVSTPEHDQNCVVQLMREGWVDAVQVIFNVFEQEPAAQMLPVALETGTAVIVRVAFDEGALTGKFARDHVFPAGDFRSRYFEGDRLARTVDRIEAIRADVGADLEAAGLTLAEAALEFVLAHEAVSVVIPGIRSVRQAELNLTVSEKPDLPPGVLERLRGHAWRRADWYQGK